MATLYWELPRYGLVWYLSPYEFITDWKVTMLSYPQNLADQHHKRHQAELTEAGRQK